jgi:uncharacterized protein (TIGR03083 family)
VLARAERADFADLLDELTPRQWTSPSLCDWWSVRDVAAHTIAYVAQSRARLALNMVRSGLSVDRLNARGLRDYVGTPPEQLANLMRVGAEPSGAGALYGGRVALIECLIHQQDVRRALREPRTIPAERLRVSLDFARISPVIAGARHTRGVRLVATDMHWSVGSGPEVHGSAETLLMAMTGRIGAITNELSGDGVAILGARYVRG